MSTATVDAVAAPAQPAASKPVKKSVALSGVTAGNTALCTVGRTGNDLHYRGYDILDIAEVCEFEEIAHLLVHGKLPTRAELKAYKAKLKALRGLPGSVKAALEQLPGVEERTFTCDGSVTIGDQVITCPYAHGEMDLSDAFARSCNGVYAQLAVELGADVLQDYARQAGLLEGFSVSGIPTVSGLFTAGSGGDLGWSSPGQFVPEFEDALNRLQPGEISQPIVSRFGVHLITLEERRQVTLNPRQQREMLRNVVREEKVEKAYATWLQELRSQAYVEYRNTEERGL